MKISPTKIYAINQRYVRTVDLDKVYAAAGNVFWFGVYNAALALLLLFPPLYRGGGHEHL